MHKYIDIHLCVSCTYLHIVVISMHTYLFFLYIYIYIYIDYFHKVFIHSLKCSFIFIYIYVDIFSYMYVYLIDYLIYSLPPIPKGGRGVLVYLSELFPVSPSAALALAQAQHWGHTASDNSTSIRKLFKNRIYKTKIGYVRQE